MTKLKPLKPDERQLAEATTRLIAKAEEIGLPDPPDALGVTPHAIRFLARAHLELRDQIRALHDLVDQTDPNDPIGAALTRVGLARRPFDDAGDLHARLWQKFENLDPSMRVMNVINSAGVVHVGEVVQLDRRTLLRFKNFGRKSLELVEKILAEIGLFLGVDLEGWPGARWECTSAYPFFRKVSPHVAPDLLALYCRVMGDVEGVFMKYESYVVRVWDGMDGCWTDCTSEVGCDEALRYWAEKTNGGSHHVAYSEIDYYRIFPGGTRMLWNGSEGMETRR